MDNELNRMEEIKSILEERIKSGNVPLENPAVKFSKKDVDEAFKVTGIDLTDLLKTCGMYSEE